MSPKISTWKSLQNLDDAKNLVDRGVLLTADDSKNVARKLSMLDQEELAKCMSRRFVDRSQDRLSAEILIESVLRLMGDVGNEKIIIVFLEEFLAQENCESSCRVFVDIALTAEFIHAKEDHELLATAVATVCEMGFGIISYEDQYPGQIHKAKVLLAQIGTYLLSASNVNHVGVRLNLFRYFSTIEAGKTHKPYFHKVMARFGHSVFEVLFQQLFQKKTEAIALQFFLDHIDCALESDENVQLTIHETFRHYMLKNPDRFQLFLKVLNSKIHETGPMYHDIRSQNFFKHLVTLYKVASDLNHRELGQHILREILNYHQVDLCKGYAITLSNEKQLRKFFREMVQDALRQLHHHPNASSIVVLNSAHAAKRGRKPSMSHATELGFLGQIKQLSQLDPLSKAS